MKVLTVVGTRPEIIRLSRVIARLDVDFDHCLVHTGQNWDPLLGEIFFEELGIRKPDYRLEPDRATLGSVLGSLLSGIEPILIEERPDAFLILGDTNSSLTAIMAKRLRIPVFHMEAGNRCFDENVPEETNRRLVDHVADFNLCYTEQARRNLLAEGLPARRVFVTGSPLAEVLAHHQAEIDACDAIDRLGLRRRDYYLVSIHREENVDDPVELDRLFEALGALARRGRRVVVSTHPRLAKRLGNGRQGDERIELLPPFGYIDYLSLQQQARCVLSDSGTISEEATMAGFPAVTVRRSMERPEALDAGSLVVTGTDPTDILRAVDLVVEQWDGGFRAQPPPEYQTLDCSVRVSRLICGLAAVHASWLGLRRRPTETR